MTQCPAVFYEWRGWWKKKTHHCCDKVSRREEKAIGIVSSFLAHYKEEIVAFTEAKNVCAIEICNDLLFLCSLQFSSFLCPTSVG